MKRRTSALFALAAASGAALAMSVPAMAQTYVPYSNNFEATGNPGVNTGENYTIKTSAGYLSPEQSTLLTEGSGSGSSYNFTAHSNYTFLASSDPTLGGTVASGSINGAGAFINGTGGVEPPTTNTYQSTVEARDGSQSVLSSWVNNTTGTTGFYRETTITTGGINLKRPTIDLGGTVSFWAYYDTGVGTAANTYANPNTTPLASGSNTLQIELAINGNANPALTGNANALGQYGSTGSTTNLFTIGSTNPGGVAGSGGAAGTGTTYPTGGHSITNGSWQYVSFNIPTETQTFVTGGSSTLPTSGLGLLYDIDFTTGDGMPGGVANKPNQVFNVYIDDLTIAPAPEPSAWLALAAGGAMLLGLGAMKARKRGMGAA